MAKQNGMTGSEKRPIRTQWNCVKGDWYYSAVDILAALTDCAYADHEWEVLKCRLMEESRELYENIVQMEMPSVEGKIEKTDVIDTPQLLRLILAIPSPKVEKYKLWMTIVAKERLDQIQDPILSVEQAICDYKQLGYSNMDINHYIREVGVEELLPVHAEPKFAALTKEVYKTWAEMTIKSDISRRFKRQRKNGISMRTLEAMARKRAEIRIRQEGQEN